jgi:phenylalanine-4-hydroxylase
MQTSHTYVAHAVDINGNIPYTADEDKIWQLLYNRQIDIVETHACPEYLDGMVKLGLTANKIPQPKDVSTQLKHMTGWEIEPVAALITFREFYELLAKRRFPAASFIRRMEDLEYLQEPDIFHEIFGHCPMLTSPSYAAFSAEIGRIGGALSDEDQLILGRLYWFTIEFGLIKTIDGLRIYGAGIISSKTETLYALDDPKPIRRDFDLLEVMRRPYHIDRLQTIYYCIDSFDELFNMVKDNKLLSVLEEAKRLGDLPEIL